MALAIYGIWKRHHSDEVLADTTQQLAALSAKDEFEVIDWPAIFGVKRTAFRDAVEETFNDPRYGRVVLEF